MSGPGREHRGALVSDAGVIRAEQAAQDHVDQCATCSQYGRLSLAHCRRARHFGLARLAAIIRAINAAARELPA